VPELEYLAIVIPTLAPPFFEVVRGSDSERLRTLHRLVGGYLDAVTPLADRRPSPLGAGVRLDD
jgi:hypothetical protein